MKKNLILILIVLIIVGAGGFFGGMKYGQSQALKNLTPEKMREIFQQRGGQLFTQNQGQRQRAGQNFVLGQVISKDEKSLTIKLADGSTKIVFLSQSTQITKATEGSIEDIEIGKEISVIGTQNEDGSLTARTIQISPRPFTPESNR
jgi:uncharacterized protein YneF (UPF0154 family)